GALGRGPQLLLRPLLAHGGLVQLGRQQVALALPLAHLRGPVCRRRLGLREARPELLELRRALGGIGLPLLAERADLALQLGNLGARLHVAEPGLLQPLLEAPALGEQRARALAQLRDLVARALLLVLERLERSLGAGERGAGALGLRVRGGARLVGGARSGERPLEVVLGRHPRVLAAGRARSRSASANDVTSVCTRAASLLSRSAAGRTSASGGAAGPGAVVARRRAASIMRASSRSGSESGPICCSVIRCGATATRTMLATGAAPA